MIGILCIALSCLLLKEASAADFAVQVIVLEADPDPTASLKTNLDSYKAQLSKVSANIIVFPEYGFTGFQTKDLVKISYEMKNETDYDDNLNVLDDFAKEKQAYVVANVIEKADDRFYSTSFVFNGNRKILAKYRKININSTETILSAGTETVTFDVENLGKVGLISGDDILYENPSQKILSDENVTTIICTASYRSIGPFRTALSVQQGYAQANGINLLVANLNDPDKGVSGSGVYSENQILSTYVSANEGTKVLGPIQINALNERETCQNSNKKAHVFTNFQVMIPSDKKISDFNLTIDAGLKYSSLIIQNDTVGNNFCDDDLCCTFTVTASKWATGEKYRLVVKGGDNSICALLWCNSEGKECGKNLEQTIETTFTKIEIVGDKSGRSFRPYTLQNKLVPITNPDTNTYFCQNETTYFNSTTGIGGIVVFGIVSASGASSLNVMIGLQLILLVTVLRFFTNA